jgi:hypothetical protein
MELSMIKVFKYLILGVVAVIVVIFLSLKWVFWEPSDIQRNSLIYYLKVPKYAKEFPLWGTMNTPVYDVGHADGEKKSVTIIYYISSLNQQNLLEMAKNLAFKCRHLVKGKVVCNKKTDVGQSIELDFVKQTKMTYFSITVAFIGF